MKIAKIFSDNVVFQANKEIRVFGESTESVTVTLDKESVTVPSKNGRFLARLSARPYGGPYRLSVSSGRETEMFSNVMIGEVLLCAGQSNMQFGVREESNPTIKNDPNLRFFMTDRPGDYHGIMSDDGWTASEQETTGCFTSIGYHVGELMREKFGVAVGIVACYQGASVIQGWIDEKSAANPEFFVPEDELYCDHKLYPKWNKAGYLYHDMFEKIAPFSFGNVIWYQGESNPSESESRIYGKMLECLIKLWRRTDEDDNLPFTVVVIHDFAERMNDAWKRIQDAQENIGNSLKDVSSVRSGDICSTDEIHPMDKLKLSKRIFENIYG